MSPKAISPQQPGIPGTPATQLYEQIVTPDVLAMLPEDSTIELEYLNNAKFLFNIYTGYGFDFGGVSDHEVWVQHKNDFLRIVIPDSPHRVGATFALNFAKRLEVAALIFQRVTAYQQKAQVSS